MHHASMETPSSCSSFERGVWWLLLLILLALRLPFMGPVMDQRAWRTSTTAYMAERMAQESPPDILHPKVLYRGHRDVRVSEFPFYPWVVAWAYKAADVTRYLPIARAVTLAFYLGGMAFLFGAFRRMLGERTAWMTLLAYAAIPLSWFYSRAPHYDITLLFFTYAFFYFGLRFADRPSWGWFALSTGAATMGFLMKAPYTFFYGLPIAVWAFYRRELRTWKMLAWLCGLGVLPVLAAWWFNEHRIAVEGSMQAGLLMPQKWTHHNSIAWFFGSLGNRFDLSLWKFLFMQTYELVLTPAGLLAVLLAFWRPWSRAEQRGLLTVLGLEAGAFVYVLAVFPMVASTHDYYSTPLMAPAALLIGLFLQSLASRYETAPVRWLGVVSVTIVLGCMIVMGGLNLRRMGYFQVDWQWQRAGEAVAAHTSPDDTIAVLCKGRWIGGTDPRFFYHANRRGWARGWDEWTEEQIETLRKDGAALLAVYFSPDFEPDDERLAFLEPWPRKVIPLTGPKGGDVGHVVLYFFKGQDGVVLSTEAFAPAPEETAEPPPEQEAPESQGL